MTTKKTISSEAPEATQEAVTQEEQNPVEVARRAYDDAKAAAIALAVKVVATRQPLEHLQRELADVETALDNAEQEQHTAEQSLARIRQEITAAERASSLLGETAAEDVAAQRVRALAAAVARLEGRTSELERLLDVYRAQRDTLTRQVAEILADAEQLEHLNMPTQERIEETHAALGQALLDEGRANISAWRRIATEAHIRARHAESKLAAWQNNLNERLRREWPHLARQALADPDLAPQANVSDALTRVLEGWCTYLEVLLADGATARSILGTMEWAVLFHNALDLGELPVGLIVGDGRFGSFNSRGQRIEAKDAFATRMKQVRAVLEQHCDALMSAHNFSIGRTAEDHLARHQAIVDAADSSAHWHRLAELLNIR